MSRTALAALAVGLTALAPSLGARDGEATPAAVVRIEGPPAFAARSARIVGGRLEVAGPDARVVGGRVLVCIDGPDDLSLWAALVGWRMSRATPLLGQEGPGRRLADAPPHDTSQAQPLAQPVQVTLVFVGRSGAVRGMQTARIDPVSFSD